VLNHELAHSIAGLFDAYSFSKEEGFNKTVNKDTATLRWKDLLYLEDVKIDSVTPELYIPNRDCMMAYGPHDYTCPVCSQRIEQSILDISDRITPPHRVRFIEQNEEDNTQSFAWESVPGATHYEIVFRDYLRDKVYYAVTTELEHSFSLPEEAMATNYVRSVLIRAYNEDFSSYYIGYNLDQPFISSNAHDIPVIQEISMNSETSFTIKFNQNDFASETLFRLYNGDGNLVEFRTDKRKVELNNLKPDMDYFVQLAAGKDQYTYRGNSALSELIPLRESCSSSIDSIQILSCEQYISEGGKVILTSGFYQDTFLNVGGCDSIISLDVTIDNLGSPVINQDANRLQVTIPDATYQWINCQNNQKINGEVAQIFTPSEDGSYAIIVANLTCMDTSECFDVLFTGIDGKLQNNLLLYPNPVDNELKVNLKNGQKLNQIEILDISGRVLIVSSSIKSEDIQIDVHKLPSGIYFLKGTLKDKIGIMKFTKN
jgi:hypothetical protein